MNATEQKIQNLAAVIEARLWAANAEVHKELEADNMADTCHALNVEEGSWQIVAAAREAAEALALGSLYGTIEERYWAVHGGSPELHAALGHDTVGGLIADMLCEEQA